MSSIVTIILIVLVSTAILIFLNGLYVGAEFATVGARKTRIRQLAATGNKSAIRLLPVLENPKELDDYVAACQLGITISSLVLGYLGTNYLAPQLVELNWTTAAFAATGVLFLFTLLQVIFGELFPKSIAVQYPEKLALAVIRPIQISQFIFRPLIWIFNGSGKLLMRTFGLNAVDGHATIHSPEEIEILVGESNDGGLVGNSERTMLRNAFRLGDLTAKQVMVHRTRTISAPISSTCKELLDIALEAGYTRIPIYEDNVDNILGFVHVKDVFRLDIKNTDRITEVMRDVVHVPENISAVDVWEKLNVQRKYMAIVFDEYGGTAGIITQEDLIEEVFGELQDEFDDEGALVKVDKEGRVHLRGDLLVHDVNEYLQLNLPNGSADTIGGLVFMRKGGRAKVGDIVEIDETPFRIEAMEDSSVSRVSIPASTAFVIPQISEWEVERD